MLNIRYENLTYNELYSLAEQTDNELALALDVNCRSLADDEAEAKYSEDYKVDNGEMISRAGIAETCVHIFTEAEWHKHDSAKEWWLGAFDRDTNVCSNHIGIESLSDRRYKVYAEYGPCGEGHKEIVVVGLKNAYHEGKLLAAEIAGQSELFM